MGQNTVLPFVLIATKMHKKKKYFGYAFSFKSVNATKL